ncbi:ABC transporter ATP-binding protein [Thiohalophilus thiocyanatoxydans]|uniref:Iron complex transport system ATP-binding protein n=1 Tax=Thiohalophilus thiocyanatoxydans TaxID=381308 RepID=A0A4R8IFR3_9GAMM|nr:ABC transporter ATP-binding protein [Thiohalophilus thiocyanatoxydans]TDX99371.1 iron complex transport system ATP-binding protein [Thiohalophilus thiocyanatoxydans]
MKLQLEQLQLQRGQRTLCKPFDLSLEDGQCWGILGSNGSGKTTLLHTVAGLHHDYRGRIVLDDTAIEQIPRKQFARQAGLLLQTNEEAFPGTALETVLTGRHPHLKAWQWESEEDLALARETLQQVDLAGFEQRNLLTLSGGERRRLYIATLLAQQPQLYLLDEPANHLDLRHQHQILGLLQQLCTTRNKSVVMVLHDPNLAARYCDHVLLLHEDGNVESGPSEALMTPEKLSVLYGYPILHVASDAQPLFIAG